MVSDGCGCHTFRCAGVVPSRLPLANDRARPLQPGGALEGPSPLRVSRRALRLHRAALWSAPRPPSLPWQVPPD